MAFNPLSDGYRININPDFPGQVTKSWSESEVDYAMQQLVFDSESTSLISEAATLDSIDSDFFTDLMILDATSITTNMSRLKDGFVGAIQNALNKRLAPDLNITNAEVGKVRKSGLYASVAVVFNVSDGQTISVIFHAPDGDPKVIKSDDTLIAFRFLLNRSDVTAHVIPKMVSVGGIASLNQVSSNMAKLVKANSEKFKARQQKIADAKNELVEKEGELQQLQQSLSEAIQLGADASNEANELDTRLESIRIRIKRKREANELLEQKIERLKSRKKESGESKLSLVERAKLNFKDKDDEVKSWSNASAEEIAEKRAQIAKAIELLDSPYAQELLEKDPSNELITPIGDVGMSLHKLEKWVENRQLQNGEITKQVPVAKLRDEINALSRLYQARQACVSQQELERNARSLETRVAELKHTESPRAKPEDKKNKAEVIQEVTEYLAEFNAKKAQSDDSSVEEIDQNAKALFFNRLLKLGWGKRGNEIFKTIEDPTKDKRLTGRFRNVVADFDDNNLVVRHGLNNLMSIPYDLGKTPADNADNFSQEVDKLEQESPEQQTSSMIEESEDISKSTESSDDGFSERIEKLRNASYEEYEAAIDALVEDLDEAGLLDKYESILEEIDRQHDAELIGKAQEAMQ